MGGQASSRPAATSARPVGLPSTTTSDAYSRPTLFRPTLGFSLTAQRPVRWPSQQLEAEAGEGPQSRGEAARLAVGLEEDPPARPGTGTPSTRGEDRRVRSTTSRRGLWTSKVSRSNDHDRLRRGVKRKVSSRPAANRPASTPSGRRGLVSIADEDDESGDELKKISVPVGMWVSPSWSNSSRSAVQRRKVSSTLPFLLPPGSSLS